MEPEHRSARGDKFNDTLPVGMQGLGGESLEVVGSQLPSLPVDLRLPRPAFSHLPHHQEGEPARAS